MSTDRRLWGSARGIIVIQLVTAVIAGLSRLVRLRGMEGVSVTTSLQVWVRVGGGAAVIIGTLPNSVLAHMIPAHYGSAFVLLPWASLIGFSIGGINLITTYWQATGNSTNAVRGLFYVCVVSGACDILALRHGNVLHLAYSAAAVTTAGLVGLLVLVKVGWAHTLRGFLRQVVIVGVPGTALLFLRGHLVVWAIVAVLGVAIPALRSLYLYGLTLASPGRPRVLHLAFEDPYRPGSGGGSVRTLEIDKRLALNFRVTVVCARYPGSKPRTEDGVRYVHIGLPWGLKLSLMSYFVFLPWALMRYPSELVVEDFAAPFSSVAVPWLTSRPVIGVVQWLFAQQKASEYRLPFHLVEKIGLSSHRNLVAVSDDLGAELQRRNPRAEVSVIQNGLPDEAFLTLARTRKNILYLGRLEIAQKGVDLLLQTFAAIADRTDRMLTIAGSGPDEERIRGLVISLGIEDRVVFAGHIAPADRFELLASAEIVAMPSRYETFGMVAAEALAVGTPVVAFDIPCLRSILSDSNGVLVPAFDIEAFASGMMRVLDDDWLRDRLGNSGRASVDQLRWDGVAAVQSDLYSRILASN